MTQYVSAINAGIQGLANSMNRYAAKKKIRLYVTPRTLRNFEDGGAKDMFDTKGKLNQAAKTDIQKFLKTLNLPQAATWDDIFEATKVRKKK